jgi:hypothetical protein
MTAIAGYEPLGLVLNEAYEQAASGKGRERHARDKPFDRQPILEIGRMLSTADGEMYQAIKKTQEASGMVERGQHDRAVVELLGAINYLAAAVMLIRERKPEEPAG